MSYQDKSPEEQADTRAILQARHDCQHHRDLTKGAKNMFVELLDLALDRDANLGRRGQIAISQQKIAERIYCCVRSITDWKRMLIAAGFVWVTKWFMPSCEPMDCYHITALQPKRDERPVTHDGFWGNGSRRNGEMQPGKGARGMRQQKLRVLVDQFGKPVSSADFSQPVEHKYLFGKNFSSKPQNLRLPTAKIAAENSKDCSSKPQNLRQATAKNAVGSRKNLSSQPQANASDNSKNQRLLRESQVGDSALSSKGKAPPQNAVAGEGGEYKAVEVPAFVTQQDLVWKERLPKKYDPELLRIQEGLEARLKKAPVQDHPILRWRIQAVDEILFGPTPPGERGAALLERPAKKPLLVVPPQKSPTTEQLLTGARYLIEVGKTNLLSADQRKALQRAGELK